MNKPNQIKSIAHILYETVAFQLSIHHSYLDNRASSKEGDGIFIGASQNIYHDRRCRANSTSRKRANSNISGRKHVVFDIIGTCVSFDVFYETTDRLDDSCGAAELEFTFLSVSERHKLYKEVPKALFFRILHMAGIAAPRKFATDAERDHGVQAYSELKLRHGTKSCFDIPWNGGFIVWCLTTGDIKRVGGYFERSGLAKPALAAYKTAFDRFAPDDDKWFAAAHMWDVSAAAKAGFRGAYCTVYEKESCSEIFDEVMNVTADTLPEMAKNIVAASQ
ncbi:uncharacterized protein N7498_009131 [Penicillium cinerascens]|uniref:2-haloalkanoic acid dehalogenase n=1 Tax=Penicillium cinerascens TaxID=70096 RepID=A0A9W9J6I6_9EURO|nr:uncharacterized protein N7498_009131 [Penicillium cinerascens]KAJ5190146.1 hypothetical protein N7498_009131 [Penicillium cinerascens]